MTLLNPSTRPSQFTWSPIPRTSNKRCHSAKLPRKINLKLHELQRLQYIFVQPSTRPSETEIEYFIR